MTRNLLCEHSGYQLLGVKTIKAASSLTTATSPEGIPHIRLHTSSTGTVYDYYDMYYVHVVRLNFAITLEHCSSQLVN
jgi:hypothetical protein